MQCVKNEGKKSFKVCGAGDWNGVSYTFLVIFRIKNWASIMWPQIMFDYNE